LVSTIAPDEPSEHLTVVSRAAVDRLGRRLVTNALADRQVVAFPVCLAGGGRKGAPYDQAGDKAQHDRQGAVRRPRWY